MMMLHQLNNGAETGEHVCVMGRGRRGASWRRRLGSFSARTVGSRGSYEGPVDVRGTSLQLFGRCVF